MVSKETKNNNLFPNNPEAVEKVDLSEILELHPRSLCLSIDLIVLVFLAWHIFKPLNNFT